MKKIGLLGLMLIALQNFSAAQTSFDVNIGGGVWTAACEPFVVEDHLVWNPGAGATHHLGFGMKSVLNGHLTLGLGVRGHYMGQNRGYRTSLKCKYPDCDACDENDGRGVFINWSGQDSVGRSIGRDEATTDYAMISVPFKIGYQIGKFNPNIGVEYNYRMGIEKNVGELQSIGITTGLRFDLNDQFAFSTDFYGGVTKDMTHQGTVYSGQRGADDVEELETYDFKWRSYRIEFTVHYKFGGGSAK